MITRTILSTIYVVSINNKVIKSYSLAWLIFVLSNKTVKDKTKWFDQSFFFSFFWNGNWKINYDGVEKEKI